MQEYDMKIKITKNGPYIVSGNVPLHEKIIVPKGKGYVLEEGRPLPQAETYVLCRCGKSKNAPFCDLSHLNADFDGRETASREKFDKRAVHITGHSVDLKDDGRCAFARFCHTGSGDVWSLVQDSHSERDRELAIKAAGECLAGRLVSVSKDGSDLEPELSPEIDIIQDRELGVSAGIFVKGGIALESQDGSLFETRNRYALCRCGKSKNKPFCDGAHARFSFVDRED
jgi:CDGSH-type Zn-finger protein